MFGIVPAPASIEFDSTADPFRFVTGTRILANDGARRIGAVLALELRDILGNEVVVGTPTDGGDSGADISLTVLGDGDGEGDGNGYESYTLDVSHRGVSIEAATAAGLYRATRSLLQLLPPRSAGAFIPAVRVVDTPRFAYRGVMLDVARHFFSVEDVLRLIDSLAMVKINTLHLHLTDDQAWRIHIDSWPELTGIGASTSVGGAGGGFYTKNDYRRIVEYATERFITIVPEIDLPGHTNAALSSYPELNPDGVVPSAYEGIDVGFSSLSAAPDQREATDRFLTDVLSEVAEITPGPWLHIGGDESLSTSAGDYLDLIQRITATAAATGKTIIGWHEIGTSSVLPAGTIAQYWGFLEPQGDAARHTISVVEQGGQVVMSPADVAYLDIQHVGNPTTPGGYDLGLDWANGPTSLEAAYSWEPTAIVAGIDEAHILGVEAPIWTETAKTIADVEFLAFPRVAAIAEIGWSPKPGVDGRDYTEFAERIAILGAWWDATGTEYFAAPGVPWHAN